MIEALKSLPAQWPLILACVLALNALLMGIYSALGMIKDLTPSDTDNKIWSALGWVLGFLQKIIDIIAGNKAHE